MCRELRDTVDIFASSRINRSYEHQSSTHEFVAANQGQG
jgi:hypothetical protein